MAEPTYSVLPHLAIQLAQATEKTDCQVTKVKVWIRTVEVLADSVAFVTSNNLVPEILARAGLEADLTYFNLLVEEDSYTQGDLFVYELRLSHQES